MQRNDPGLLPRTPCPVVATRNFNRGLKRFSARITKEHPVGKAGIDQTLGRLRLRRNGESVRDVHERCRLRLHRFHEMRVRVAKRGDRNPAHKIEISAAILAIKPGTLPVAKGQAGRA